MWNRRSPSRAPCLGGSWSPAIPDRAWTTRGDFPFSKIATGDLDIAVVGQLPPPKFALSDQFEPGSVEMVGFEAAFRRWGLWKQGLEYAPRNAHHALILTDAYAELDGGTLGVPPSIGRKTEEHESPGKFC
jgi:hypothetical protein